MVTQIKKILTEEKLESYRECAKKNLYYQKIQCNKKVLAQFQTVFNLSL